MLERMEEREEMRAGCMLRGCMLELIDGRADIGRVYRSQSG